jgi:hypothetical protein
MNTAQKAQINRELSAASKALHHAFALAASHGDLDLANNLRKQQIAVATKITELSGGPIKLTGAELLTK